MTARSYPIPTRVRAAVDGEGPLVIKAREIGVLDHDDLERVAWLDPASALGMWATGVLARETAGVLDRVLDTDRLPMGLLADEEDEDVVIALFDGDRVFTKDGWGPANGLETQAEAVELDEATIAFVASAFGEGVDGVLLRAWYPLAILAAPAPAPTPAPAAPAPAAPANATPATPPATPANDIPEGAKVVAVVDELDKTAVIDLLTIAPGPVVSRRNDGKWERDDGYLSLLRSVNPPPLVELSPDQVADVEAQVDESTRGMAFTPLGQPETPKEKMAASAWSAEHQHKADELAVRLALIAASKAGNTLKGKAMGAEKLRDYWLHGKGAVKIRWGAPGDWKRCVRHLSKYMGPRATGYCSLMHARATGAWTGSKVHRKAHGGIYPNPKVRAEARAKQLSH